MILNVDPQLSQWDVDRIVVVSDTEATYMHFANPGDSKAVIMEIVGGEVQIPNYLLQTGKSVIAYAVLDGVTVGSKTFPVRKRERPENYVYEEDRRNYIYELIADTENAAARANEAADRMNDHIDDRENPHRVTPEQIGAVSSEDYNTFFGDVINHITSVEDNLSAHSDRKDNPHNVTAEQIGAVKKETFEQHADDKNNPHNITCDQIGAVTQKEFQEVLDNLEVPDDGNSGQLIPHITNRDNPHEVTAEQVGAVKEEELAGKVETIIEDDYNNAGGIFLTMAATAETAAESVVERQLAANLINRRLVGHDPTADSLIYEIEQDNYAQVTAKQVGAAPAGYGLGENSSMAKSWNNHWQNGFFREKLNSPTGASGKMWYGITCVESGGNQTNIAFSRDVSHGLMEARRYKEGSTFGEWEYVNPPMLEGVEYRTTERFNGKPVYAKYMDSAALKTPGSTNISVAEESVDIIEIKGYLTRDNDSGYFPLPYFYGGNACAYIYAGYATEEGNTTVNITTTDTITTIVSGSQYTAHVTVKYTKK